jgi:hypothetical protein
VKNTRCPLKVGWQKTQTPVMCAYKLVTVEFKWFGLQGRMEKFIHGVRSFCCLGILFANNMCVQVYPRLFTKLHREVVCWMDKWIELTMEDIRRLEEAVQKELDEVHLQNAYIFIVKLYLFVYSNADVDQLRACDQIKISQFAKHQIPSIISSTELTVVYVVLFLSFAVQMFIFMLFYNLSAHEYFIFHLKVDSLFQVMT